jgi:hypothetical protein
VGNHYNGYSWSERDAILKEVRRLEKAGDLAPLSYLRSDLPCDICADPNRKDWHSEDYSLPFLLKPPATFAVCAICHQRLHKRFQAPDDWCLFLAHLRSGGYGREFTGLYSKVQRDAWAEQMRRGQAPDLPKLRARPLSGSEWWLHLTVDRASLTAAWARPRPLRPRPTTEEYRAAIAHPALEAKETALLAAHAKSPKRTATMRSLSQQVFGSNSPSVANAHYGALAHRLSERLGWSPDKRADGSSIWMTALAEGWQPEGREFEWVMVPALAVLYEPAREPE